ncbi:MAG: hypothetical protein ABMA13_16815 [Chthoniobacteraceae bacterium]
MGKTALALMARGGRAVAGGDDVARLHPCSVDGVDGFAFIELQQQIVEVAEQRHQFGHVGSQFAAQGGGS